MPENGGIDRTVILPDLPVFAATPFYDPFAQFRPRTEAELKRIAAELHEMYRYLQEFRQAIAQSYDILVQRMNELPEMIWLAFGVTIAAGLTNQALGNGISFNGYPAPEEGSVVAIGIRAESARTAGTLTVEPTIGGTGTGFTVALNATNTQNNTALQDQGLDKFNRGQIVGCRITTTGDYAPTGVDLDVCVGVVVARGVQ